MPFHLGTVLACSSCMPRPPRNAILGDEPATIHFIWRCHNRDFLMQAEEFKIDYLGLLRKHKEQYGIEVYAYALMDNHFHAVLHLPDRTSWQRFSRRANSLLARKINRVTKRSGQVVMDRPRTIVLERDQDVLAVMRYIDLNPVRAGIVRRAREYRWSSYRHHATGHRDELIDPCPAVQRLGRSPGARCVAYRELFAVDHQLNRVRRQELVAVYFLGRDSWVLERQQHLRRPPQ